MRGVGFAALAAALHTLACAWASAGCSCSQAHELDAEASDAPDARSVDAAIVDANVDANVDAAEWFDVRPGLPDGGPDTGICGPGDAFCTSQDDCIAWGRMVGPPGTYISSMCPVTRDNPVGRCTPGVYGCTTTHDGRTRCYCGPYPGGGVFGCLDDEICVSDTPGGPTRCAQECIY